MENTYGFGATKSPFDLRTFTHSPEATTASIKGGTRWLPEDIRHQHKVGICTAISLTSKASKYFKIDLSPEFQYLMQKTVYDKNWLEGSSIFYACKVGYDIGFLPKSEMDKWITEEDRMLPYMSYVAKLQAIPQSEIDRMKTIASALKIKAYAILTDTARNTLANAIDADTSNTGILARFDVGSEWWTAPIEPLRAPKIAISGHAINISNYDGDSFRDANTWGVDWADKGTAYFNINTYKPTEAWQVWFNDIPNDIKKQQEDATKIVAQIIGLLQKLLDIILKK